MSKCLKFFQRLKFKADLHSKMSICRHELGGGGSTPQPPGNSNPETRAAYWRRRRSRWSVQRVHDRLTLLDAVSSAYQTACRWSSAADVSTV